MANSKPIIRPFISNDSLDELTELLHRSYEQLADAGMRFIASHQDRVITQNRISRGTCLIALIEDRIIGTVTVYLPYQFYAGEFAGVENAAKVGQFGILPEFQQRGIGTYLMNYIESYVKKNNVYQLVLDTAENAEVLLRWYDKLGFRFVKNVDWEETNYRSVVLVKSLT